MAEDLVRREVKTTLDNVMKPVNKAKFFDSNGNVKPNVTILVETERVHQLITAGRKPVFRINKDSRNPVRRAYNAPTTRAFVVMMVPKEAPKQAVKEPEKPPVKSEPTQAKAK